jgi:hypothetical protein
MKAALTTNELWRLTRIELSSLAQQIKSELPTLPEDSPERVSSLTRLRNIGYLVARRDFSP